MNYLIRKKVGDSRKGICNIMIPDGFMTVLSLSFENQKHIRDIMTVHRANYEVVQTDLPEGYYAPNGCRVTLESLWNWVLYNGELVYVDKVPENIEAVEPMKKDVRPPDLSQRPEYVDLESLPAEMTKETPEVAMARKILEAQTEPAPPRVETKAAAEDEIPLEDDVETLSKATGNTDELAMLRAALDAKGVEWTPSMNRNTLRKKLNAA